MGFCARFGASSPRACDAQPDSDGAKYWEGSSNAERPSTTENPSPGCVKTMPNSALIKDQRQTRHYLGSGGTIPRRSEFGLGRRGVGGAAGGGRGRKDLIWMSSPSIVEPRGVAGSDA